MIRAKLTHYGFLVVVILIGVLLRFYNLAWDNGLLFHPDELNMGLAMSRIHFFDSLDPGFYAYNGFALYLYKALAVAVASLTDNPRWADDISKTLLVGRHVSALVSSFSLVLIYWLGLRLAGARVAFLATALAAFNVGFIQCAHFAVTESLLVFFLLLTAICAYESVYGKSAIWSGWLCLVSGLAIGTKTSALSFLIFVFFAVAARMRRWQDLPLMIVRFLFAGAAIAAVVIAVSPFSFINLSSFLSSMAYEGGVVKGSVRVPYTLQFNDTTLIIPWINSLYWLCTPPVVLVGLVGLAVWLCGSLKDLFCRCRGRLLLCSAVSGDAMAGQNRLAALSFLLFGVAYGAIIGSWHTKFVRYLIPLLPVLLLSAAWATEIVRRRFLRLGTLLVAALLGTTGVWSACYFSIYLRPDSRITASQWLYDNVQPRSHVIIEHYDLALPVPIRGRALRTCLRQVFPFYDADNSEKMRNLAQALASADLIILASRRLYSTIPKDPEQYPYTSRYYTDLFAGRFGFKEVAAFSSPPGIGPLTIADDLAEETFQVFDHPKIRVFARDPDIIPDSGVSVDEITAFLMRPRSDKTFQ